MYRIENLRVYKSIEKLPQDNQLAYKLAKIATNKVSIDQEAEDMVINRIIDNASVAIASVLRPPVIAARDQALCHPKNYGATIFGLDNHIKVDAEWAAWANCVAVRELDYHDTFLAADYSHPGDNIPPILAVAQQCNKNGADIINAIINAYEIHIALVKGICLHKHKIDHVAHLCPSQAAGIASLLGLSTECCYQAIQQALHVSISTRQSRKGEISSWKAYVPGHGAKLAIEAVDRAMRGEKSPSPIYEGEDSVIAQVLDGPIANYHIPLPILGKPKRAILESFTKEHSAEYQSQALIDLAFRIRGKISDFNTISKILIETSHHTHYVIGTGACDPQKMDANASRETLDHSIMFIFSVALFTGEWHHERSYDKSLCHHPIVNKIWKSVETIETDYWTSLYHNPDHNKKAFGGKVNITFSDGTIISDSLERANAHPAGARPFNRKEYIEKFDTLTYGIIERSERNRFLGLVQDLPRLTIDQIKQLNITVPESKIIINKTKGIF